MNLDVGIDMRNAIIETKILPGEDFLEKITISIPEKADGGAVLARISLLEVDLMRK